MAGCVPEIGFGGRVGDGMIVVGVGDGAWSVVVARGVSVGICGLACGEMRIVLLLGREVVRTLR